MLKNKRWFKWLSLSLLFLLSIFLIGYLLLQTSPVQNYIAKKIVANFSNSLNTKIEIGKIKIDFFDQISLDDLLIYDQQNDTLSYGKNIVIDIALFSLLNKKFGIDDIKMEHLYLNLYSISDSTYNYDFIIESSGESKSPPNEKKGWQITLNGFDFKNVRFDYQSNNMSINIIEDKIKGDFYEFNIPENKYMFSNLSMNRGKINFTQNSQIATDSGSVFSVPKLPVVLSANILEIEDHSIYIAEGDHEIEGVDIIIKDFNWRESDIVMKLNKGAFLYNQDFAINALVGDIIADSTNFYFNNIRLETERDQLSSKKIEWHTEGDEIVIDNLQAKVSGPTLFLFKKYFPEGINVIPGESLHTSVVDMNFNPTGLFGRGVDLKYGHNKLAGNFFLPLPIGKEDELYAEFKVVDIDLNQLKRVYRNINVPKEFQDVRRINLAGVASGTFENITLRKGEIKVDNKLTSKFSGNIHKILNPERLSYNLVLDNFKIDSAFLSHYNRPEIALDQLGELNYNGAIMGDFQSINLNGIISTSLGIIDVDSDIVFPANDKDLQYDGQFALDSFDLGQLIMKPEIGKLTLVTKLSGIGLDLNTSTSNIYVSVASINYKGYNYQNIEIEGTVNECIIEGDVVFNDPNAKFVFKGMMNLDERPYVFDFKSSIDTINFTPLNLNLPEVGISGDLFANFTLPIKEGVPGKILMKNFAANNVQNAFKEDSLSIDLTRIGDSSIVHIFSTFLESSISGEYRLMELPDAFRELYNFYALGDSISFDSLFDKSNSKNIHIVASVTSLDFLEYIQPGSNFGLKLAELDYTFDFNDKSINGHLSVDSLVYNKSYFENVQLNTSNLGSAIKIDLVGNNIRYGKITMPFVTLNNLLDRERLLTDILIQDEDRVPKFKVGTNLYGIDKGIQWKLNDSLVLNNQEWFIKEDNKIIISDKKLLIKNLVIFDKDEQMTISTMDSIGNDIEIIFADFNIGQFISLLSSEKSDVTGRLNGKFELRDVLSEPYFLANLTLFDIIYREKPVGSIELSAIENPQTGIISGTFDLIGSRNDILGRGYFNPESRALDWNIFAGLLEMRLLDPFLEEFISNSEGVIFGEVHIGGTLDQPEVTGEINLEEIATTIDINNTRYNFENHLLLFDNQKIDIGSVEIFDQLGNAAIVSGSINHNYYTDLILDFQLNTDKFLFLNTTRANNPIFYGKILLDATVDLKGPPDLLDVQVVAKSLDETSINLSPFSETESILKEEFIRYGKPGDFDDLTTQYLQKLGREYPFDVYITLEAHDESEFTFVVDPLSGDKLNCNGNGNLQINLDPYGEQEIFGTYTVSDGTYSFSYGDFINKKFKLTPGGSISFNGNPFNAILDVKAVYTAYTTTYELIRNEVSLSDSEASTAQRRTKVNVILSLSGSLMEPEISLDIEIPDLQSGTLIAATDRKLNELRNNPDELNNQVFGLLVFNSFLLSESSTTDFNSVGQDIALSSISNLISNQLNKFAQNVIRGVDVSIDVNSYNSQYLNEGAGGNITEVGLNVSKQLFNNRVKVSAGGNLNFDNSITTQNQFTTFIGDFVVEYKLNEQGNYRIRVFSRSNYDQLLNQNTSKTGVSLLFSKQFDSKIKED